MERISRHEYFIESAKLTAKRSTCPKKQVGAVLVKEGRIIAMGYNGVLPGTKHEEGIDELGITHTVHAEANLIAFCAKEGISTNGCTLYTTLSPCIKCAELIIQSGIKNIFYIESYRVVDGLDLLSKHNVKVNITL